MEGVLDQHPTPDHHKLLDEAIHEGHHHPLPLKSVGGGSEETAELAKAMGVSHTELLQENKQLLQEAEQRKQQQQKEWEELQQAVPDLCLNPAKQEQRLRQISEERRGESGRGREGVGRGDGGRRERGERGRRMEDGRRGGSGQQRRQDRIYDIVGDPSQGATLPAHSQQQQPHNQPHPGVAEHNQPQIQPPVKHPLYQPQEQQPQPEFQAHWRSQGQQFQQHPEHEHKEQYHNIPSTNVQTTFSSTGASYGNASTVPPAPQPLPQPQYSTQPGQNHISQLQPQPKSGQHHVIYSGHYQGSAPPSGLDVGSGVRIAKNDSRTGVIRWIGTFPGVQGTIAGIELDEPMEGCGDGEWRGHRHFTCPYGRGFFCPLANVRADTRLGHLNRLMHTTSALQPPARHATLQQQLIAEGAVTEAGLLVSKPQETGCSLGKGSYGEVVEVRVSGRLCAAKKVHGIFNASDVPPAEKAAMKDRFEKECNRVLKLKHANIIEMIGVHYDQSTGLPTLVMELMDTSLCSYLENNPASSVTLTTKYSILLDVTSGLVYLHSLPMIHRDLTANNILLARQGDVMVAKIADLGQAKNDPVYASRRQQLSKVPGNEAHMPPEAWFDNPQYTSSLDIFSFGVVMLHTLSHEWPKPLGRLVSATEICLEVDRRKPHLDKIATSVLRPLIMMCLSQKPKHRPATSELFLILSICMGKQSVPAGIGVESPVQLKQDISCTGVIRWMGHLPEAHGYIAGVEMDGLMEGCGDGEWKGDRYFTCAPGRALFCPIATLQSPAIYEVSHQQRKMTALPPPQEQPLYHNTEHGNRREQNTWQRAPLSTDGQVSLNIADTLPPPIIDFTSPPTMHSVDLPSSHHHRK